MNIKRYLLLIILLIACGCSLLWSQTGLVNSGARIVIGSGASLKISGGSAADYTNLTNASVHGRIDLDGKVYLEGDWMNNATGGTVFINTGTDGEVIFKGGSQQVVGGSSGTVFEKLTLDNSSGIALARDVSLMGNLGLTNGNITLGSYDMIMGSASSVVGTPSVTRMVVASSGGSLIKIYTAAGSFTFPVGDNTGSAEFTPAIIQFTSGTFGGSSWVSVNLTDSKHLNNQSGTDFLSRYWTVDQGNISNFSANVTFQYASSDVNGTESNIYGGQWSDPNWMRLNLLNTSANLITGSVSHFSEFTGGENSEFSVSMSMEDDGLITEASENNEVIRVTLKNDQFANPLIPANWTLSNLPAGVSRGSVNRINSNTADVILSGNRTKDFDSDITNISLEIDKAELVLSTSGLSSFSGVSITAVSDIESISISSAPIIEGNENGQEIFVTLAGGSFSPALTAGNWSLSFLPAGVSIGNVSRTNANEAVITLSGNRTMDYDVNISNIGLSITEDEFDESDVINLASGNTLTFTAKAESAAIQTAVSLAENNLDGAVINLELSNESFADGILTAGNFTLNNVPPGTSIAGISYVNSLSATLTLAFNGTDFDADYANFNITVSPAELAGVGSITSNSLTISAVVEPALIYLHHAGLTEANLNNAIIGVGVRNVTFADGSLDPENFVLTNAPSGVSVSEVNYLGVDTASVKISFNGMDFDSSIPDFYIIIKSSELSAGSDISSFHLPITAIDDAESISMGDDGLITEGQENGEQITVSLSGGTYADPLSGSAWIMNNLPAGVIIGSLSRTHATQVVITLSGNRTVDYDNDILNAQLIVSPSEIIDHSTGNLSVNTGVRFSSRIESSTISSAIALTESNLNGAELELTLGEESFIDGTLNPVNFTLNNVPPGTSLGGIAYVNSVSATLTLAYDGTDFDSDYPGFSITINSSELQGSGNVTSNAIGITSILESAQIYLHHAGLTEANLNNAIIGVGVRNETFANGILDPANFVLTNAPVGSSVNSVNYLGVDTANLQISFDGTDFDNTLSNFYVFIKAIELSGGSGISSFPLTINANDDEESLTMADDGLIEEGQENGELIAVSLSGGSFANPLTPAAWSLNNQPAGVGIGSVTRVNATQATITLSGNRTVDYDNDITSAELLVNASEVNDHSSGNFSITSGVSFHAKVEVMTISSAISLNENNLDAAVIELVLTLETFADGILSMANFSLNNVPSGTSISGITYVNSTSATLTLAYDGTDFDSDFSDFNVTVASAELAGAGSVTSNSLPIAAIIEASQVHLHHPGLTESNLNNAVIGIGLRNETFADGTLNPSNFSLNNAPVGATVGTVTYLGADTASMQISFDGTDFDNTITNFYVVINSSELSGGSGIASLTLTITGTDDAEIITMADDGLITEGQENGELLIISLNGGTFADPLSPAGWVLNNLPAGVSIGSVARTSATTATIVLSGNRTVDYDSDIMNIELIVSPTEVNDHTSGAISVSTGIAISARNETVTIDALSLTETNLNGAEVGLKLIDEYFSDAVLNPSNFVLNNVPSGTSIGSITYEGTDSATLSLSFDGTDFDEDYSDFSISVSPIELAGLTYLTSNSVLISGIIEQGEAIASHAGLTENNLDGAVIGISLIQGSFTDGMLNENNFLLNNAPPGVIVNQVTYLGPSSASVGLSYNGTDFDSDYSSFSISINRAELAGGEDVTSNPLTILCMNDPESISVSDDGTIMEGMEDGEVLTISLSGGTYSDILTSSNWTLTGLPAGVSMGSLIRVSSSVVTMTLEGNRTVDYDTDISDVTIFVKADEVNEYSGADLQAGGMIFIASVESAVIEHAGLTENNLDGAIIGVGLMNDQFADPSVSAGNVILNNAPAGLAVSLVTYIGPDQANVTLSFNGTDFDSDINNFSITISALELAGEGDITSGNLPISAVIESETIIISHAGLTETNLDGSQLSLALQNVQFADAVLDMASFSLNNAPVGLSISGTEYVNASGAILTLAFDGTDFDSDITDFSISVLPDELNPAVSITSNVIPITAVKETGTLALNDPGLTEGNLDGSMLELTLYQVEFTDGTLDPGNILLNNAPSGVSLASATYMNATTARVSLSYDGTDFDFDIFDFSITILASELNQDAELTSGNISITSIIEPADLLISPEFPLTEQNLDGSSLTLKLVHAVFEDALLEPSDFQLINGPPGLSIDAVTWIDDITASLLLSFIRTDFDRDVSDLRVRVDNKELSVEFDLTSNSLSIEAIIENEMVSISHSGLSQENLDGAGIAVELSNVRFVDMVLDEGNFQLNNAPPGTRVDSVKAVNDSTGILWLAYDNTPFNGAFQLSITVLSSELEGLDNLTSNILEVGITGIDKGNSGLNLEIYAFGSRVFIRCDTPEELKEATIYNLIGQEVSRFKLELIPLNEIQLDNVSNAYIIKVLTTKGIYTAQVYIHVQ